MLDEKSRHLQLSLHVFDVRVAGEDVPDAQQDVEDHGEDPADPAVLLAVARLSLPDSDLGQDVHVVEDPEEIVQNADGDY